MFNFVLLKGLLSCLILIFFFFALGRLELHYGKSSVNSREHARSDRVHSPVAVQLIVRRLVVEGRYPRSHVNVTSSPISYTRFKASLSIPSLTRGRPHTKSQKSLYGSATISFITWFTRTCNKVTFYGWYSCVNRYLTKEQQSPNWRHLPEWKAALCCQNLRRVTDPPGYHDPTRYQYAPIDQRLKGLHVIRLHWINNLKFKMTVIIVDYFI